MGPLKLDWYKDVNWVLFDPNELQRFAQQKGRLHEKTEKKSPKPSLSFVVLLRQ